MIAMVEQIKNSNFGTGDYIRIIQNYCDLHEKEGTSISNCFERLDDDNMAMYFYLGTVSFLRIHDFNHFIVERVFQMVIWSEIGLGQ